MQEVVDPSKAVPLTLRARLASICVMAVIITRGTAIVISIYLRIRHNCSSTCQSQHILRYFVNPPSFEARSRILG